MRQIPGVQNAVVGLSLPYEGALNDGVTLSDGKETGQEDGTDVVYVTPGYFDTLQMPVLAGRVFTDADGPNSRHVAVVNLAFARKFYGGTNPVGRYINKDTMTRRRVWRSTGTWRWLMSQPSTRRRCGLPRSVNSIAAYRS